MSQRNATLGLVGICVLIILLSFGGLAWDFATHLEYNIDGLLLILICLIMGGVFTLMLAMIAGWLPQFGKKSAPAESKTPTAAPAKAAAPTAAPANNPVEPGAEQGK